MCKKIPNAAIGASGRWQFGYSPTRHLNHVLKDIPSFRIKCFVILIVNSKAEIDLL